MIGELARNSNAACKSPPSQDGRRISCGPDSSLYGNASSNHLNRCRVPTISDFSRKDSETPPVPLIFLRQDKGLKCLASDSLVGNFGTLLAITAPALASVMASRSAHGAAGAVPDVNRGAA